MMKVAILIGTVALLAVHSSAHEADEVAPLGQDGGAIPEVGGDTAQAQIIDDTDVSSRSLFEYRSGIDSILRGFLEQVRAALKTHEPVELGELPVHEVQDDDIQVNLKATDIKIFKLSTFEVNRLHNSMFRMTEEFKGTYPVLEFHGEYETEGTIEGSKAEGKGHFEATVTNVVAWGKVYAKLRKGKVQIKKLNLDYSLSDITTKATGFKIEGKSDEEAAAILNKVLLQFLVKNEKYVTDIVKNIAVAEGNAVLSKMSLKELLSMLQHFKPQETKSLLEAAA